MDTNVPVCVCFPVSSPWKQEKNQISLTETNVTKSGKIYEEAEIRPYTQDILLNEHIKDCIYRQKKTHHSRLYTNPEYKLTPPVNT